MKIKKFFSNLSTKINQELLKYTIFDLLDSGKYQKGAITDVLDIFTDERRMVVILEESLKDISTFDQIVNILNGFNTNDIFKNYTNTLVKAFDKDKDAMIGYSFIQKREVLNIFKKEHFDYILPLLEFVMFLTENNISLEDIELINVNDFTEGMASEGKRLLLFLPHKLKLVKGLDVNINVKWFLKSISKSFDIEEEYFKSINLFEEKFYFSSKLLKLYTDVFFYKKERDLKEIYKILEEEVDPSNLGKFSFNRKYYNSNKFFCAPNFARCLSTSKYNKILRRGRVLYKEKEYKIICFKKNTYLIFNEFSNNTLNLLRGLSQISIDMHIDKTGFTHVLYNAKEEHPIGFVLDTKYRLIQSESYCKLTDMLDETKASNIISIIGSLIAALKTYFEYGYTFNACTNIDNIIYVKQHNENYRYKEPITFANFLDIQEVDSSNLELFYSIVSKTILKIFSRYIECDVLDEKVVYTKGRDIIYRFSPSVIRLFEKYILTGNLNEKEFYENIFKTTKNYLGTYPDAEYYSGYVISPIIIPFKFEDEVKKENYIQTTLDNEAFLTKLNDILSYKETLNELGINLLYMPKEIIYNRHGIDNFGRYKLCGFTVSEEKRGIEDRFKSKNICSRVMNLNTYSNKDAILDLIKILKMYQKLFPEYIPLWNINMDQKNELCIKVNDLLTSNDLLVYSDYPSYFKSKRVLVMIIYLCLRFDIQISKDYFDNISNIEDLSLIIDKLQKHCDSLTIKCEKHSNYYYSEDGFCKRCNGSSIAVDVDKLGTFISKEESFDVYNYGEYINGNIFLNIFNDSKNAYNTYKEIKNIGNKLDTLRIPGVNRVYKKFLNMQNNEVIGFATINNRSIEYEELADIKDNKRILLCLASVIRFFKKLYDKSFTIDYGTPKNLDTWALENVIAFTSNNKVVLKDMTCLKKQEDNVERFHYTILQTILNKNLCKVLGYNSYSMGIELRVFEKKYDEAEKIIISLLDSLDSYCQFHSCSYSSKTTKECPICKKKGVKKYSLNYVKGCEVFSDIGKEAILYDIGDGLLGKVYRMDENGKYISEVDINKKIELVKKLLDTPVLNNTISLREGFEIVNIKGIIEDADKNFCGVVMEMKKNTKSIKILTDRAQRKKLNISREDIFKILIATGKAIEFCHKNNLYIGDISYNNILFDIDTKIVYLIDFDSINTEDSPSTVFTEQFVDPLSINADGYSKPSATSDWYAFATLVFYVFTLLHPFNGSYLDEDNKPMRLAKRKAMKISVLGEHDIKIPPIAISWDWMSDKLKSAFLDIFEKEKRYNITDTLVQEYAQIAENVNIKEREETIKQVAKTISNLKCILVHENNDEIVISKHFDLFPSFEGLSDNQISLYRKQFYECTKNVLFDLTNDDVIHCSFYKKDGTSMLYSIEVEDVYSTINKIKYKEAGFAVPYSNTFLCILSSSDGWHKVIRCDFNLAEEKFDTKWIKVVSNLPNIHLSVNTRYGNNDVEDLVSQYINVVTYVSNHYFSYSDVMVYADLITDNWLLVPICTTNKDKKIVKDACIYSPKTDSSQKIQIQSNDFDFVSNNHAILFDKAIYYPADGKIYSKNLINSNCIEFICDKVKDYSIIKIIKKGFRIYNLHHIYDIEQDTIDN